MLPLLSLHVIAAPRGEGLHPVLLAALKRLVGARAEHVVAESSRNQPERAAEPATDIGAREEIAKRQRVA